MRTISKSDIGKFLRSSQVRGLYQSALPLSTGFAGTMITFLLMIPMPALLGPMLINGALVLTGLRMKISNMFFPPIFIIIGIYIGSAVRLENFGFSFLILCLFLFFWMILATAASSIYLQRYAKMDKLSATYAAIPGAFASIIAYSDRLKFDHHKVFLSQTVRLFLVIALLPIFLSLFVDTSIVAEEVPPTSAANLSPWLIWALCMCSIFVIIYILNLIRVPAPYLIGAIIGSSIFFGTGMISSNLPNIPLFIALYILGSILGTRFNGFLWKDLVRFGFHSLITSLIVLVICLVGALVTTWFVGTDFLSLVLAFGPGGINEISIIAYNYGLDLPVIVFLHIIRITTITFCLPLIPRLLRIDGVKEAQPLRDPPTSTPSDTGHYGSGEINPAAANPLRYGSGELNPVAGSVLSSQTSPVSPASSQYDNPRENNPTPPIIQTTEPQQTANQYDNPRESNPNPPVIPTNEQPPQAIRPDYNPRESNPTAPIIQTNEQPPQTAEQYDNPRESNPTSPVIQTNEQPPQAIRPDYNPEDINPSPSVIQTNEQPPQTAEQYDNSEENSPQAKPESENYQNTRDGIPVVPPRKLDDK